MTARSRSSGRGATTKWLQRFRFPRSGTIAAQDYWISFEQANRFADFILGMAAEIERVRPLIAKARAVITNVLPDTEQGQESPTNTPDFARGPLGELAGHAQFFCEVFLVRHVENYLSYLSALLFAIFQTRPEAMRSSEKVDLDFVLEHQSY